MNGGGNGGGIAGLFFPGLPMDVLMSGPAFHGNPFPVFLANAFPNRFSSHGIEGHDAGIRLSAHHDEQKTAFEDGGAANSEEGVGDGEIHRGVALPDQLAGLKFEAGEFAFGSQGVTHVGMEQGGAARAIVRSVRILELARVGIFPKGFARGGLHAFHGFLIARPMMEHQSITRHRGCTVTGADRFIPKNGRAIGGPTIQQSCFGGDAIGLRSLKTGPVTSRFSCLHASAEGQGHQKNAQDLKRFHNKLSSGYPVQFVGQDLSIEALPL